MTKVAHRQQPEATTRRRVIEQERAITLEAAKGVVDPAELIARAERRAYSLSAEYVDSPMQVTLTRDRLKDGAEELLDFRNHLVWWLQEHPDDPRVVDVMLSLRFVLLAYDRLPDA